MIEKELRDQVLLAIYNNQGNLNIEDKPFCEKAGIIFTSDAQRNRVFKSLKDNRYINAVFYESGNCYIQGITTQGVDHVESKGDHKTNVRPLKEHVQDTFEYQDIAKENTTNTEGVELDQSIDIEYDMDPSMYTIAKGERFTIKTKNVIPCFQVGYLSKIFADHIDSMTCEDSQMVGIFGKWGRGKTYFWDKVKNNLDNSKYTFIEFNAWKYQETPALWAYLYLKFQDAILSSWWKKLCFNIRLNLPYFIRDIIILMAIILIIAYNVFGLESKAFKWVTIISAIMYWLIRVYQKNISPIVDSLIKLLNGKDWSQYLGLQAEIERDLVKLLKKKIKGKYVGNKKIILFIDDIDRCNDERMINIIDSLRTVLENEEISKRLIIVCAVDASRLRVALEQKYATTNKPFMLSKEQMDKIFLSGIKLRQIYYDEQIEYIKRLVEKNSQIPQSKESTDHTIAENSISDTANDIVADTDVDVLSVFRKVLNDTDASEITPRQLRIIYYRYMLANNILQSSKIPHDAIAKSIYYKTLGREEIINLAPSYNDVIDTVVCY